MLIEVVSLTGGEPWRLAGPGVGPNGASWRRLDCRKCFLPHGRRITRSNPLGIDVIFTAGELCACLPRSVRLEIADVCAGKGEKLPLPEPRSLGACPAWRSRCAGIDRRPDKEQMRGAVDRVMTEGALYDRDPRGSRSEAGARRSVGGDLPIAGSPRHASAHGPLRAHRIHGYLPRSAYLRDHERARRRPDPWSDLRLHPPASRFFLDGGAPLRWSLVVDEELQVERGFDQEPAVLRPHTSSITICLFPQTASRAGTGS